MRIACATALLLAGVSLSLFAQEPGKPGFKLDAIKVGNLKGEAVSLPTRGNLTAVIFVSTECPVSNAYNGRMKALVNDYSPRGVRFVFVNSNANETPDDVAKHARDSGFAVTPYKDPGNKLADTLNAQVTPEVFLFDRGGVIVYHGSIDDARDEAKMKRQIFREALNLVIAGAPIATSENKAFGCTIKRAKKDS